MQPGLDMEMHLADKAERLGKKRLRFQPHVVCLCQDLVRLGQRDSCVSYAVIDSHVYYETSTLSEAVDICIKAAFVFGIEFAPAAHSSWLFVQRAVFKTITDFDSVTSRVLERMTDTANLWLQLLKLLAILRDLAPLYEMYHRLFMCEGHSITIMDILWKGTANYVASFTVYSGLQDIFVF